MVMSLIESLTRIKNAVYGREVREAIHDGVFRANQIADGADAKADKTQIRQDAVEAYNDQMIQEMTDRDVISAPELIEARKGENKLSTRLDKEYNELTAQLAGIETDKTRHYKYTSDYLTVQDALNDLAWNNELTLENRKVYVLDSKLTVPSGLGGIKINGNGATFKFTNSIDCGLDLTSINENYGNHTIENLKIEGTNAMYPSNGFDSTNKGIGLKVLNNGGVRLTNVTVQQFDTGLLIENSVGCIIDGTSNFSFNSIGIKLNKMSNTHKFFGTKVRENRKKGIEISGLVASTKPTHNVFYGCYIESNIPYNTTKENAVDAVGVEINDGYDNIFRDCYFENHKYSILIKGSSDKNLFDACRLNANTFGNDTIKITGDGSAGNKFINCIGAINYNVDTVEFDATNTHSSTVFDGCEGFNLDNMIGKAIIKNCTNIANPRLNNSSITLPPQGVVPNAEEGPSDKPGSIIGMGTTTATLIVKGLGEIGFGNKLTAATTITSFTGLIPNSFLYIYNYQESHTLTIKASERYQSIVLNKNTDVLLRNYGDSVLFWVNGLGRAVEMGRNTSI